MITMELSKLLANIVVVNFVFVISKKMYLVYNSPIYISGCTGIIAVNDCVHNVSVLAFLLI